MAKSSNQKSKLLYLLDILKKESDEDHPLSTAYLIERLGEADISSERKTIYSDMECLSNYGYDICKKPGKYGGYYLGEREFELAELKLLVDAVQSSKFITVKKSRILIKKLSELAGRYEAGILNRQVDVFNRIKTMNESIYYNVDKLHRAMNLNKQITFKYFDWNYKKERVFRHDNKSYCVSPWSLCWDDENYYLISYDSAAEAIKHFRVDKMMFIEISEEMRQGKKHFDQFDSAQYSKQVFGMFSGTPQPVELRCKKELAHILIDRFGNDIVMRSVDEEHFDVTVKVITSPPFYSWVFQFNGKVKILSPQNAVDSYHNMLKRNLDC